MNGRIIFEKLASEYPLIYLNPNRDSKEKYQEIVLRGGEPENRTLSHYNGNEHDKLEIMKTPAGPVQVVTIGDRRDFELVVRGLMAAKNGPLAPVLQTQGAAAHTVFSWRRINSHLAEYPEEERAAEFRRFTSVKENYIDMLVVLSRGGYSGVSACDVGHTEDEWLEISDTIRRFHELTHVVCRRLYPDDIDSVRDELIADAIGLYAAYGFFDIEKARLFLGIKEGRYVGGRLGNYTSDPEKSVEYVNGELERINKTILAHSGADPFALISTLMESVGDGSG